MADVRPGGKYEAIGGLIFTVGLFFFRISIFTGNLLVLSSIVTFIGLGIFIYGRIL